MSSNIDQINAILAGILASPSAQLTRSAEPRPSAIARVEAESVERRRLHDAGQCDPSECEIIDHATQARIEAAEARAQATETAERLARIATLESEIARDNDRAIAERARAKAERSKRQSSGGMIPIPGNSYPVKDALRGMGGRWDAASKVWSVPADRADEARALVLSVANVKVPFRDQKRGNARRYSGGRKRAWKPCGYPGCNPSHCDECEGKGGWVARF